jgi:hypothetical protein
MKAFAVLAVMLVCSVGVWTTHQAGMLGPMVRRQLVSGAAAGSATGAGLSCPIGSYNGGVNGCRGCGPGLITRAPGAMKLDDCGELQLPESLLCQCGLCADLARVACLMSCTRSQTLRKLTKHSSHAPDTCSTAAPEAPCCNPGAHH